MKTRKYCLKWLVSVYCQNEADIIYRVLKMYTYRVECEQHSNRRRWGRVYCYVRHVSVLFQKSPQGSSCKSSSSFKFFHLYGLLSVEKCLFVFPYIGHHHHPITLYNNFSTCFFLWLLVASYVTYDVIITPSTNFQF